MEYGTPLPSKFRAFLYFILFLFLFLFFILSIVILKYYPINRNTVDRYLKLTCFLMLFSLLRLRGCYICCCVLFSSQRGC